jgi:hypothetical protein
MGEQADTTDNFKEKAGSSICEVLADSGCQMGFPRS